MPAIDSDHCEKESNRTRGALFSTAQTAIICPQMLLNAQSHIDHSSNHEFEPLVHLTAS